MTAAYLLRSAADADRPMLERLWQLYSHDMSQVRGSLPDTEGLYRVGRQPTYFGDPDSSGWVVEVGGRPAGFAFLTGLVTGPRSVGDFFVVRAVRRQGIAYAVAGELVQAHPGPWEIGFQLENVGAAALWRQVVADVTRVAGTSWREELRTVPDRPEKKNIPDDHVLVFAL